MFIIILILLGSAFYPGVEPDIGWIGLVAAFLECTAELLGVLRVILERRSGND